MAGPVVDEVWDVDQEWLEAAALESLAAEFSLRPDGFPLGCSEVPEFVDDDRFSDEDLLAVKERVVAEDLCVLGLRFTGDRLAPAARFASLRRELGSNFVGVEIDSSRGNPWGHRLLAHGVLTEDLIDEPGQPTRDALEQVLQLFRDRLLTPAS